MKNKKIFFLVAGVVSAIAALFISQLFASGGIDSQTLVDDSVNAPADYNFNDAPYATTNKDTTYIMVTSRDISMGDVIQEGDIIWQEFPDSSIQDEYITRQDNSIPSDFVGQYSTENIAAFTPVRFDDFGEGDPSDIASTLKKDERIVFLSGDPREIYINGRLFPGDYINIAVSIKSNKNIVTHDLIGNARVYSVGEFTSKTSDLDLAFYYNTLIGQSTGLGSIGLYVTKRQSELLNAIKVFTSVNNDPYVKLHYFVSQKKIGDSEFIDYYDKDHSIPINYVLKQMLYFGSEYGPGYPSTS